VSLADEILDKWAPILSTVDLKTGAKGRFEVTLDGDLLFSKAELGRHANPGEVAELVGARLGPALKWRKE